MKVGDLVQLKSSVLHTGAGRFASAGLRADEEPIGVITEKHLNAVKVHWFGKNSTTPNRTQYVLKLKVLSSL
jgi:hypothetical protein